MDEVKRQPLPRPLFGRVICFSVPVRRKLEGSSLYVGNRFRGAFDRSRGEPVWIISTGPDFKERVHLGQKAYVHDGFEVDSEGLDLWPQCRDWPEFAELKKFAEDVDGDIYTMMTNENSLVAVEE